MSMRLFTALVAIAALAGTASAQTQGGLTIAATQVAGVGSTGTMPTNVILTWTPNSANTVAPTTITVTSTVASMWDATLRTLAGCVLSQAGSTPTLTSAITTTTTLDADTMTITLTGAAASAPQADIVLTCSTANELAANPAAITAFTATAVSSADATQSASATYDSVTAMTAIDGDVDVTIVSLTPTKFVLKATPTTAIGSSGTITFTAGGTQSAIWVNAQTPACTGTKAGSMINTTITSLTSGVQRTTGWMWSSYGQSCTAACAAAAPATTFACSPRMSAVVSKAHLMSADKAHAAGGFVGSAAACSNYISPGNMASSPHSCCGYDHCWAAKPGGSASCGASYSTDSRLCCCVAPGENPSSFCPVEASDCGVGTSYNTEMGLCLPASSITITIAAEESVAAGEALVFECTGSLAANSGTVSAATTFTATSSGDAQQVAFVAGYVTTAVTTSAPSTAPSYAPTTAPSSAPSSAPTTVSFPILEYFWDFTGATGGNIITDSTGGVDATLFGGATRSATGVILDGVNGYVDLNLDAKILGGAMTIEIVVKYSAFNGGSRILSLKGSGTTILVFNEGAVGKLAFWVQQGQVLVNKFVESAPTDLILGVRHHIIVLISSTAMVAYIDGVQKASSVSGLLVPDAVARDICYIGKDTNKPYFDGEVSSLKIYSGAMSQAEVTAAYEAAFPILEYAWDFTGTISPCVTAQYLYIDGSAAAGDLNLHEVVLKGADGTAFTIASGAMSSQHTSFAVENCFDVILSEQLMDRMVFATLERLRTGGRTSIWAHQSALRRLSCTTGQLIRTV